MEEETAARVKVLIEQRVKEVMNSDAVQLTLKARLETERRALEEQVIPHSVHCLHWITRL